MILTYGESEKGLVRKVNEDAINLSVNNLYLMMAAKLPAAWQYRVPAVSLAASLLFQSSC